MDDGEIVTVRRNGILGRDKSFLYTSLRFQKDNEIQKKSIYGPTRHERIFEAFMLLHEQGSPRCTFMYVLSKN